MTTARYLTLAIAGLAAAVVCLVLAEVVESSAIAVVGVAMILGVVAVREHWQHAGDRVRWKWQAAISVGVALVAALIALLDSLG